MDSDLELVPKNVVAPKVFRREYSVELGEEISDLFASGHTIVSISRISGMPAVGTIYRWIKDIAEFEKKITAARAIRAIALEDEAIEVARAAVTKEGRADSRLNFDAAIWAAEKNDPARYGRLVKVEGTGQPLQIVVRTNVPDSEYDRVQKQISATVAPTALLSEEASQATPTVSEEVLTPFSSSDIPDTLSDPIIPEEGG